MQHYVLLVSYPAKTGLLKHKVTSQLKYIWCLLSDFAAAFVAFTCVVTLTYDA